MILTDFRFPEALDRDMIGAAFHLCDKARSLSGASLFGLLPKNGTAAIGVQVSFRFYANGNYRAARFQLAPEPNMPEAAGFHTFVSFSQGYQNAQNELLETARRFWVSFVANQVLKCHGRVLGEHQIEDLEAMQRKHHLTYLRWANGSMEQNECLCAELAGGEINAREDDSSHDRIMAIAAARKFTAFRKIEDATALNWWNNLAPADRSSLPEYSIRDLPEGQKALFTYRDYLANRYSAKARSGRVVVGKG